MNPKGFLVTYLNNEGGEALTSVFARSSEDARKYIERRGAVVTQLVTEPQHLVYEHDCAHSVFR